MVGRSAAAFAYEFVRVALVARKTAVFLMALISTV
jgi:hypothetical protein